MKSVFTFDGISNTRRTLAGGCLQRGGMLDGLCGACCGMVNSCFEDNRWVITPLGCVALRAVLDIAKRRFCRANVSKIINEIEVCWFCTSVFSCYTAGRA